MTDNQRIVGAALNPMGYSHFTDHLAAIAVVMGVPLVFTDVDHYEQSLRQYPELIVQLHDWAEFTPSFIVENYDVLFISEMWNRDQLRAKFHSYEAQFGKTLRVVHCPHGFSDKGFWFEHCLEQDVTLVYGQNMLDLLSARRPDAALERYVLTGNLRYQYYLKHQAHFDKVVATEVFSRFGRQQPTIIYAPTWRDNEDSTSFFKAAEPLLSELPNDFNLLVKLHPNLEHDHDHMVDVYETISKYELKPNIVFLSEFPLIYPLLAACDIYIGDRSAVGYDFLAFNRPMFFLNESGRHEKKDRELLYSCGQVLDPGEYSRFYKVLEEVLPKDKELFSKVREETYQYTFADRPFEAVRQEIIDQIR